MIWIGLIIGFTVSAPLGYFLGKRTRQPKTSKKKKRPEKQKPLTFDEMMINAWTSPKHDPQLAAEVDADIEERLKEI